MKLKKKVEELERENRILKNLRAFLSQRPCVSSGSSKSIGARSAPSRRHAADGSLEIRFLRASRRKKPNAQIERGALEGLAVERLPSAQGPLRPAGASTANREKRHRREREARAPYHAKARTRRKGRDPKTPHPEEGRAGRPSAEPGRARFLRGRAQQGFGWAISPTYPQAKRVGLSRSRDRRLLPQGRGRSMSERITEKVAIDAIGQAVGRRVRRRRQPRLPWRTRRAARLPFLPAMPGLMA